jgi:ribosomal protein L22
MKVAIARASNLRISFKHSIIILKELKNKKLEKGKKFLEDLIDKKVNLSGKYYTNTAKKIFEVLKSLEANAKQKNLNVEKLFIKTAKANKGEVFIRPKSRWRFRGRRIKSTNIEIIAEER